MCLVDFELQLLSESVLIPAVHHGLVDIKQDCINILGLVKYLHVMRETDAQEIVPVDFGRRRRPIYELAPELIKLTHFLDTLGGKTMQSGQLFLELLAYGLNGTSAPLILAGMRS